MDAMRDDGDANLRAQEGVGPRAVQRGEKAGAGEVLVVEAGRLVVDDRLVVETLEADDVLDIQSVGDVGDERALRPQASGLVAADGVAREAPELVPGEA